MKNNEMKTLIRNTFLELYLKYPLNEIRVNNICTKANIGRSTFYNYYKSINDILREIETNIISDMMYIYNEYNYIDIMTLPKDVPSPNFYEMYKYILKNKTIFECLLEKEDNSKFIIESKKSISKKLNKVFTKYIDNHNYINYACDICSYNILISSKILLKYSNVITPKSLAIQTKKMIIDIIENKNIYLKERNDENESNRC